VSQGRGRDLDEDDIRVRPGRGKSRPRTKDRPAYDEAVLGWVVTVDRGRFGCLVDEGTRRHTVTAMKSRELGRKAVVVGDQVALIGALDGADGSLARIVRVQPRRSVLRRTADDTDPVERVVVANADQLAVVTSVANPQPRPRLIDRCLVAAYDAGLDPLLIVTKTDLAAPDELLATYRALDVPHVALRLGSDLEPVRARLQDRRTVFVGHSGVGKSTLVNALVPGADRATGAVNLVTGRGRHISTSAVVLELPGGGWVIDTPGIRSFGLAHVDPSRVVAAFPDLAGGTAACPRSCSHDEPECGLDAWVAAGHADPARLDSLRRLLRARELPDGD
jgi:ribosome biogenesis GTPase / thiamine phosphate phosphatase